ncbi:MAG: DMT family transporter [Methylophilaceae bacterium]
MLFGTLVWGTIWYPYRLLNIDGVTGVHSSMISFSITFFLSFFIHKFQDKSFFFDKSFLIYAFFGGITNIAYVMAVIHGEVVRVMLLFFLSPLWTMLLALFLLKERATLTHYIAALLSVFGAIIILYNPSNIIGITSASDLYALIAGVGFSMTNVLARRFTHLTFEQKSIAIWLGVILVSIAIVFFYGNAYSIQLINISIDNFIILIFIAITLLVTTLTVQYGLTRIKAVRASPIFLFEIIVAAISSYLWAGEVISTQIFLGGMLIVFSVLVSSRKN